MAEGAPARKLIIPKGVLESGNNVIEIPESCEDSRVLIAKLQAKYGKPPRYYPPKTNPENKFERRIGDVCVGMGMPALSPVQEERRNYQSSLSQYGTPRVPSPADYESCDPSYFGRDTTHGSNTISGKFDYCPSSTPIPTRSQPAADFPSPKLSPIRMGRDVFAPDPSVYRSAYTPPRMTSPVRSMSPPRPRRPDPQSRSPVRRPPSPGSDRSCSFGDISGMIDVSRANRTPESMRGLSKICREGVTTADPIPEELDNSAVNRSLAELEYIELDELRSVQEKMRNFQEARRELVISILSLHEAEVSG